MKIQVTMTESDVSVMLTSYLSSQGVQLSTAANKEVIAKLVEVLTANKLEAETLPRIQNYPTIQYLHYPNMPQPNTLWWQNQPYCLPKEQSGNGIGGIGSSGITTYANGLSSGGTCTLTMGNNGQAEIKAETYE